MKIKLSFHGCIYGGKTSTLEILEAHNYIQVVSAERVEIGFNVGIRRIIKVKFLKNKELLAELKNCEIELSLVSGDIFELDNVFDFLIKSCNGIMFFFTIEEKWRREQSYKHSFTSGEYLWNHLVKNFYRYHSCKLETFPLVFCYNQVDLIGDKEIDQSTLRDPEAMNEEINTYGFPYFATSALKRENIFEAFEKLLELILEKQQLL